MLMRRYTEHVENQALPEVSPILMRVNGEMDRAELMNVLGLKDEEHFRMLFQQATLALSWMEMALLDKPKICPQKTDSSMQVHAG
jgi:hypothetical protein